MKNEYEVVVAKVTSDGEKFRVEFNGTVNDALNLISVAVSQVTVMGYDEECDAEAVYKSIEKATQGGIAEGIKRIKDKDFFTNTLRDILDSADKD